MRMATVNELRQQFAVLHKVSRLVPNRVKHLSDKLLTDGRV